MIVPVRCFTCGKVIGSKWEEYQKLLNEGKSIKEALDILGLERMCCRKTLMSVEEHIDLIGKYDN